MISVMKGDITRLDFDAIVNPTNSRLDPEYGVSKDIFDGAGPGLVRICRKLDGCDIGQAKMTLGYGLRSKVIIHTAQPFLNDGIEYLEACYWNSFSLAYSFLKKNKLEKVLLGIPPIGTGTHGFSSEQSCKVGVQTIKKMYQQFPVTKKIDVIFVCSAQHDYLVFKEGLKKL